MGDQHSPGPWTWTGAALRDASGATVLDIECPPGERENVWFVVKPADAALIVSAPALKTRNAELVKALTWAMSILDAQNPCDSACGPHCSNRRARALLGDAQEKSGG